ncbi:unnamed protein product [Ambrosiozyma monospora]|uniref:Unnamed protein product n=1 Tax=Ambrosiozyma monospora TaxID=43982 RepID=A0ACB5U9P3_AMBMO|nr:unnamed protein product [Ambrosiozyma monospora]
MQTMPSKTQMPQKLILDAHWDKRQNLILGHAALGGGDDRIRLAIFGSQGVHSWPVYWEGIQRAFSDCTRLNVDEVANDCNECAQYWECLTVSLGAFLHEIGHSLGCPHQENGVMLRDYVSMNRKFLSEERNCVRTNKGRWGPVLTKDEPGWNRLDLVRFLYHPAFAVPGDFGDPEFRPPELRVNQGMRLPPGVDGGPNFVAVNENRLQIISDTGTYLIEIHVGEWSRLHYEYLPKKACNGLGAQRFIELDYDVLQKQLAPQWRGKTVKLEVLCAGFCQKSIDDLQKFLRERSSPIPGFGGHMVRKSEPLGGNNGNDIITHLPPNKRISMIRVTSAPPF